MKPRHRRVLFRMKTSNVQPASRKATAGKPAFVRQRPDCGAAIAQLTLALLSTSAVESRSYRSPVAVGPLIWPPKMIGGNQKAIEIEASAGVGIIAICSRFSAPDRQSLEHFLKSRRVFAIARPVAGRQNDVGHSSMSRFTLLFVL